MRRAAPWLGADALALVGLLLLLAWQLWPAAGPGRLPQNLDLMLQYVPNAAYLQRSLAEWRLPLWNPYLGAGMPFAADPGTGAWYLPGWLPLGALPLFGAVRVALWGHLAWGAAGTYLYLRRGCAVAPAPAWIGAAAFALTTWLPGLTGMPVVLTAVSWLPWVLLAGDRAMRRGGVWVLPLAGAATMQVLAGWPAGAYLSWLALGATVLRLRPAAAWPRAILRLTTGATLAVLLAGVLLVPAAELVSQTSYAATRPVESVSAEGYLTLLSWLRPAGGAGALESSQLYLGMTPVLLALAALLTVRRRTVLVFGVLALLALLLAAGTHAPLFAPLYHWLPGFRIVYLPARVGILAAFAVAVLAACGAQGVLQGGWRPRHVAAVAGLAGVCALAVLLQFWHSEGYDNFRRLLTNVGRFSGAPFLTRQQEAHYLAFGVLGLAALLAATWLPPRLAGPLLVLVTAADLGLAQSGAAPASFNPLAWYGRATAGAPVSPTGRVAGPQWHGRSHFLADFPRTADPARLPPNLALLTGRRDAQAYNPLLLRRAVDYFGRINGGRTDDHWLWIEDFRSPLVDALAVRDVLASPASAAPMDEGDRWRLARPLLWEGVALPPDGAPVDLWPAGGAVPEALHPGRLYVVTYLGQATTVPQGAGAIELQIRGLGPGGVAVTREVSLRAGLETAEWAYGRPDVQQDARHGQAPVALETRLVGAVTGSHSVYEYLAAVDVSDLDRLDGVTARATLPGVLAFVQGLSLAPQPDPRFTWDGGVAINREAQARASLRGGDVRWLTDRPERISLRTSASAPVTLVLADAFYPGWTATVGGAPAPIEPVDGLFRGVAVPAGDHDVVLSYRPPSLLLGGAATVAGLLIVSLQLGLAARGSGGASQAVARVAPPASSSPASSQGPAGPGA